MSTAISIRALEWKYEHAEQFALRGVDLDVEEGAFLGIIGGNEQGKTTLVSAIKGLIPHSFNGIYRGSVDVFGHAVRTADAAQLTRDVGFVFSDPEAQFTAMTVEEELVFGMENLGFSLSTIRQRLAWVCDVTMIGDLLDKSPYDISGGQKQRVAISCVLAMDPRILILDEPTSMIDPLGKDFIFGILRRLKAAGDRTIIVVEHNIEQLAPLADVFALVHEGRVARTGSPDAFFSDPALLAAHGVYAPEATRIGAWLRDAGHLPADRPLPRDLDAGIAAARAVLGLDPVSPSS
jgi:energy-coupling factor transport system ATP-binding protein